MASHDLQEPLRKIRMFSDRLYIKYKDQLDDDGISNIKRIQNAAERMQALIKDILTFSKLSIEKDPFVKTDLEILVQEVWMICTIHWWRKMHMWSWVAYRVYM